jgi:hypothetical protein
MIASPITTALPYSLQELFERVALDGSILLDPKLNIWKDIADTQPKFHEYLNHMFEKETVRSPDGSKKHPQYKLAMEEVLNPKDETNQRTYNLTVEYLSVQCAAGVRKMHDPKTVLPQYLSSQDGAQSFGKQAQGHADSMGCECANDKLAESVFGTFDRMLKQFSGISREAASALAQAMRHKSFWRGDSVERRKQQQPPPPGIGYFWTLPWQEREALVEYSISAVRETRKVIASHK